MRLSIKDLDLANSILRHPDVYPFIRDDYSPTVEDFTAEPLLNMESVYFLLPAEGCLFMLTPFITSTVYEGHTAVIPESRGKTAIQAGRDAIAWMFSNTRCEKIVGFFHEDNRRAIMWSIKVGMKRTHLLTGAMRLNGVTGDLVMVEVDKHPKKNGG